MVLLLQLLFPIIAFLLDEQSYYKHWVLIYYFVFVSDRYADMLVKLRAESLAQGQEFLTWNDVQKCIDTVNFQVHEENESKGLLMFYIQISHT